MAEDSKYDHIDIKGIPRDEPVFILRAQDVLAPVAMKLYADLREAAGDRDGAEKVRLARRRFLCWSGEKKLPD